MVEVLDRVEDSAGSPGQPASLSPAAAAIDPAAIWARLEAWTNRRFMPRTVTWVIAGPGAWKPDLRPATIDSSEVWQGEGWVSTTLRAAPLGFTLDSGAYRVTATVGTNDAPPAEFWEAFRRLAEYLADDSRIGVAASSATYSVGNLSVSATRPQAWQAKAIQNSGAADLLRRYR